MGLIKDVIIEEIEFLKKKLILVANVEGVKSEKVMQLSKYIDTHIVELLKLKKVEYVN